MALLASPLLAQSPPQPPQWPDAHTAQSLPSGTLALSAPTTAGVPEAFAGLPYHASIALQGGSLPYTITLQGDLPDGLTYQPGLNVVAFSGVPSNPGEYTFQLSAIDANGATVTHPYTLSVNGIIAHPDLLTATIADPEALHITDATSVFFPAVINVAEPLNITDGLTDYGSVQIAVAEPLHITDTTSVFFPSVIAVAEPLQITDATSVAAVLGITPTAAAAGTVNTTYPFTTFSAVGNTGAVTYSESGAAPTGMTWATSGGKPVLYGTPAHAGNYPFSITAKDTVNTSIVQYTLVINPASQTVSFGTLPTPTYGNGPFTLSASSTSGLAVTITPPSTLVTGTNPYTITGAGLATFTASQAGNADYNAATPVQANINIAPASLSVTATNLIRTFDQPNPALTYAFGSFAYSDTASVVSGAPTIATTATPLSTVASSPYTISVSLGTLAAANYAFSLNNGTLTINKASQTITFYPLPTLTNGSAAFPLSARAGSGLPVTYSVTGPATLSNNAITVVGSGLVTVTAMQPGNANYNSAANVVRSFTAP